MKRRFLSAVLVLCMLATLGPVSSAVAVQPPDKAKVAEESGTDVKPDRVEDELLVKFKKGVKEADADAVIKGHGATKKSEMRQIGVKVLKLKKGQTPEEAAAAFKKNKNVEFAEPNGIVKTTIAPNDPYFDSFGSWGQSGKDLWGVHRIKAPDAWEITTGSDDVIVAVSDTGLDFTHEDIQGNVYTNPGESGSDSHGRNKRTNGVDDDGNGYIDDWRGWDFVSSDNNPTDDHGHGTHCAGTIAAAADNGKGVAGVAWNASILPIKFLNAGGSGYDSNGAASIVYAANMGARVVSCSWGGEGTNHTVQAAVDYARSRGTAVIAAAGNDAADAQFFNPANCTGVITVAATAPDDTRASFSNYGSVVEVAAPGVDTLSLQAAGTNLGTNRFPGYNTASGTSMATPHVSGIAALLFSLDPDLTVDELEELLVTGSEKVPALSGICASGGVVSAYGSLDLARRPRMQSSSPEIGERQVALDTSITVEFSCAIEPGSRFGDIALRVGESVLDATVEIDGERLTVNPTAPLEDNMRPVLTIPAGAVASLTGFGSYKDYEVPFFTPDFLAPMPVSTTPADGATGVSLLAPATVTFDEDVVAAESWDAITVSTGGSAVSITRKTEDERLVIGPASGMWNQLNAYTVTVPAGAVKDRDGNSNSGPVSFTFTTDIGSVRVEDADPKVEYATEWQLSAKSDHSGGTARYSATPRDWASLTFTGTEVSVLFCMMTRCGPARFYIDDVFWEEVNTYSSYYRWKQRLFVASGLSPDTHTIRVEVGGTGTSAIMLDAFDVRPTADTTPPSAPSDPVARPANEGRIDVSWGAPSSPDIAGYHVYRSLTAGGPYEELTSELVTGTTYRDATAESGTTYRYVVSAVDASGNESAYSSEVSAAPASDTEPPSIPAGLDAHAVFEGPLVSLFWQASTDDLVVDGYEVERSVDGGITWVQIATTEAPNLTDTALLRGSTYLYRIRSSDGSGNRSAFSQPLAVGAPDLRVESSEAGVTYEGQWYDRNSPLHSGGSARDAYAAGSAATLTFSGTQASVVFATGPNRGTARVYVDDVLQQEVDTYRRVTRYRQTRYTARELAPGVHTLRVVCAGTGNPEAIANSICIDAFDVAGAAPPAPPGLEACAVSGSAVDLSWGVVNTAGFAGYNLYRTTTSGGFYEKVNTSPLMGNAFRDSCLVTGVTYHYVVTAVDAAGHESLYSSEANAMPLADTQPPSVPAGFDARTSFESDVISLSWQASTDNMSLEGYEIERSADGGVTWAGIATRAATTYEDAAVLRGVTYKYRVQAYDLSGNCSGFAELSAGVPNLRVEEDDPAVTYAGEWNAESSPSYSAGAARRSYRAGASATLTFAGTQASVVFSTGSWMGIARVYVDDVMQQEFDTYSSDWLCRQTLFAVRGLAPGVHTLRVEPTGTKNAASGGPYVYVDAFDVATSPPPAPSGLVAAAASGSAVDVSWNRVGVAGIVGYNLYRSVFPGGPYEKVNGALMTVPAHRDSGLVTDVAYHYVVTAVDATGRESAYSSEASITPVADNTPPSVPEGFDAQASFEGPRVALSWHASSDDFVVDGYEIERSTDGGITWAQIATTASATTSEDFAVLRGIAYGYRVRAYDASGNRSGYSDSLALGVPDLRVEDNDPAVVYTGTWYGYPGDPYSGNHAQYAYADGAAATLTFSGTQASVAFLTGPYMGVVRVYVDGVLQQDVDLTSAVICYRRTVYTARGLSPDVHTLRVEAAGGSVFLDAFDVVTSSPPAPSGFTAAVANDTAVDLSWSMHVAGVVGHNVYRSQVSGGPYEKINGALITDTAYRDTGLETGTTYHYVVTTVDAAGRESAYSTEASATPVADTAPPSVPVGLDAHAAFEGPRVALSWHASSDDFAVDGYEIERSANGGVTWAQIATTTTATTYEDVAVLRGIGYAYRVRAYDASGNRSGYSDSLALGVPDLRVEDNDPAVALAGTWYSYPSASHSGNHAQYMCGAGPSATLTFSGTQASVIFATGSYMGIARVYIDDVLQQEVDTYSSDMLYRKTLFTARGLAPDTHSLRVELTGRANPASTGSYIYLDAFDVVSAADITPPPVPSGVAAAAASDDAVDVSWDGINGAGFAGYNVYRSQASGGSYERTNGSLITETAYRDSGLATGATYHYVVTAVDSLGHESAYSAEASATPVADTAPPSVPAGLDAGTSFESDVISLSWHASTDDLVVGGYEIERSADGGVTWALIATTNAVTHEDTAVLRGTAYDYRVRAYDASGNRSGYSHLLGVGVPDLRIEEDDPAVVYSGWWGSETNPFFSGGRVRVAYQAGNSATLTFSGTQVSAVLGTAPNCGVVRVYLDGVLQREIDSYTPGSLYRQTLFAVRALAPDTHTLRVQVTGTRNPLAWGDYIFLDAFDVVTAEDITPPPTPSGLDAVVSTSPHEIALNWSSVAAPDLAGYNVYRDGAKLNDTPVSATVYADAGIAYGSTYRYEVSAVDTYGNESTRSAQVFATPVDTTAPSAPTDLAATAVSETGTSLSWTASSDNVGVTGYRVERAFAGSGLWAGMGTSAITSFNGTGLSASTSYDFRVLAIDAAGNESVPSDVITITTPDTTAPSAPTDLAATAASETGISLSWTASSDNVGVTGYRVERAPAGTGLWAGMGTSAITSFNGTGLSASTSYDFRVLAIDAAGNESVSSDVITITTLDTTAPSAPTDFHAIDRPADQGGAIDLDWTAAIDNVGVTGYTLHRGTLAGVYTTSFQLGSVNRFTDTTAVTGTTYYYAVSARDAAGNGGAKSLEASAVPIDNLAPAVPTGLTAVASASRVDLTWSANTEPDVAGYNVYRDGALRNSEPLRELESDFTKMPIAAGDDHTVGLKEDGTVVAAGDNANGQLNVSGWTGITAIAAGRHHTVGLKEDGTVVAVGNDYYGECNVSSWTDIKAVAAGDNHTVGLKEDGTVVATGYGSYGQLNVSGWTHITAIAAGQLHTVGLKEDGTVVAVGNDYWGQRDVSSWTDIKAITAGTGHTVGLKKNGTVVAAGDNRTGQCDVPGWTDIKSVATGNEYTLGLKKNGTVVAVGYNGWGQSNVSGWTAITAIDGTWGHTVGLKSDGTVVTTGNNTSGQRNVSGWTGLRQPPFVSLHADVGLPAGTYSYRVSAVDTSGNEGERCAAVSATVPDTTPPSVPASVTASDVPSDQGGAVDIRWNPSSDNVGVTGYRIRRGTASGSCTQTTDVAPGSTWRDTNATTGVTYYYAVSARDAAGNESALSAEVSAFALDNLPPLPPTGLSASPGESRVDLAWLPNTEVDLVGYRVYRNGTRLNDTPVAATAFADTGLTDGTTYLYAVSAVDVFGNEGVRCTEVPATPVDLTKPSVPASVTASDVPSDQGGAVDIRWNPSSDNVGVTGYRIRRGTASGSYSQTTDVAAVSTWRDTNATTGVTYYYAVSARDAAGNESALSAEVSAFALDNLAPLPPTGLSAAGGSTQISLSWSANTEADLAGYNVYRSVSSGGGYTKRNSGLVTGTSYNDATTAEGVTYYYMAKAVDTSGNESTASNEVSHALAATPPTAPAVSSSTHPVQDTWYPNAAPTFNFSATDASGISGYSYLLDQVAGTVPDAVSEGAGTSKSYSGLADGEYYFHVRAVDGAGNWGAASHYRVRVCVTLPANVALGKTFTASSQFSTTYPASRAGDGSAATDWRSVALTTSTKTQWLRVDLGAATSINRVVVNWNGACFATAYQVQTSTDGTNWTTQYSTTAGTAGIKTHTFPAVSARYVRLYCTAYSSKTGYWVNELEAWSAASGSFALAGGAPYTYSSSVVAQSMVPGAVTMAFDTGSGFGSAQPYASAATIQLPSGEGTKTVAARYFVASGAEILTLSDSIVYDASPAPTAPTISSSTHPSQDTTYAVNTPSLAFSAYDASGISGYSYALDQVAGTVPDAVSEGTATSKSYAALPDGIYYFHVRGVSGAGEWGAASHFRIRISTVVPSANVALGKTFTASSQFSTTYPASRAGDGSAATDWRSVALTTSTKTQWLRVDLGAATSINRVVVNWNGACFATAYQVQTSTDGTNWTTQYSTTAGTAGIKTHTFPAVSARYVRLYCTAYSSKTGYWVNELEAWTP